MVWVVALLVAGFLLSRRSNGNPVAIALGLPVLMFTGYVFIGGLF